MKGETNPNIPRKLAPQMHRNNMRSKKAPIQKAMISVPNIWYYNPDYLIQTMRIKYIHIISSQFLKTNYQLIAFSLDNSNLSIFL